MIWRVWRGYRFFVWFIIGAVVTIHFFAHFAPHSEHTQMPLSAMPSGIASTVCSQFSDGHPVSVVRTEHMDTVSLYNVTCSDGAVFEESW